MHGLWGMGQMMFTKYIIVVDDDVDVHNTSDVLFRLCANTDPQRDSIFTKGPDDVLYRAKNKISTGTNNTSSIQRNPAFSLQSSRVPK